MPRGDRHRRGGFTLVELMIAAFIFTLVLGGAFSAVVGGTRLLRLTFARAEQSLRAREQRERILFHTARAPDNAGWMGLASVATNAAAAVAGIDTGLFERTVETRDNRVTVTLTARAGAGALTVEHGERVVVPVFGKTQRTEAEHAGGIQ